LPMTRPLEEDACVSRDYEAEEVSRQLQSVGGFLQHRVEVGLAVCEVDVPVEEFSLEHGLSLVHVAQSLFDQREHQSELVDVLLEVVLLQCQD